MADPTLKDVLDAIAKLDANVAKLDANAATKGELGQLRAELAHVRAEVNAHRAETAKGFAELDRELTGHAAVHRELEKDVEALKRRPPRTAARAPRRR